jgi:hypothetical protein
LLGWRSGSIGLQRARDGGADEAGADVADHLRLRLSLFSVESDRDDPANGAARRRPAHRIRKLVPVEFGGTFGRLRDIKWLFSHAGGTIPMLAGRIQAFYGRSTRGEQSALTAEGIAEESVGRRQSWCKPIRREKLLPEIRVVGNGFISLMAYQAKGYAYIAP